MTNKVMESLELLENKIESIKWLINTRPFLKKTEISNIINIIRKSAGILGKGFPKGTCFEDKIRKEWRVGFYRRIS